MQTNLEKFILIPFRLSTVHWDCKLKLFEQVYTNVEKQKHNRSSVFLEGSNGQWIPCRFYAPSVMAWCFCAEPFESFVAGTFGDSFASVGLASKIQAVVRCNTFFFGLTFRWHSCEFAIADTHSHTHTHLYFIRLGVLPQFVQAVFRVRRSATFRIVIVITRRKDARVTLYPCSCHCIATITATGGFSVRNAKGTFPVVNL